MPLTRPIPDEAAEAVAFLRKHVKPPDHLPVISFSGKIRWRFPPDAAEIKSNDHKDCCCPFGLFEECSATPPSTAIAQACGIDQMSAYEFIDWFDDQNDIPETLKAIWPDIYEEAV